MSSQKIAQKSTQNIDKKSGPLNKKSGPKSGLLKISIKRADQRADHSF